MYQTRCRENYTLDNGLEIPKVGLGTGIYWYRESIPSFIKGSIKDIIINHGKELKHHINLYKIIQDAPYCGCPMIDTARDYGVCESIVGHAISSRKREDAFIITKLGNKQQRKGNIRKAVNESLKNLKTDYIDLYLMHWPNPDTFIQSWKEMEELYEEGIVRAIGVCNFHIQHLEQLLLNAKIKPMVNQFEHHPLLTQIELVQYCKKYNIQIMAYAPTAVRADRLMNNAIIKKIAEKYHKSVSQIIFRWDYQNGIIPIPATVSKEHLRENINIFNFELTSEELEEINNLDCNYRIHPNPDTVDFYTV